MQPAIRAPLAFKTREQATYEALRRAIVEGRWGQSQPLVVSRLAEELGVSRITVANALKRLSGEGFVQLEPHKGAVVARLDPNEVREIYLMRGELEALSTREAAGRVTPADLRDLHELNDEIAQLHADGATIAELREVDARFHTRLRAVARMPHLAQTLKNLADQCEGYRARLLDERPQLVPTQERHGPLLAAIERQDPAAAAETMREHILGGMRAVLANLDEGAEGAEEKRSSSSSAPSAVSTPSSP
jgi:DNA-binding GntR family transcriptional regulator